MSGAYHPIENYGVIGNLQTVALIGMDASIDFLCFPYFDSPSIFASLLDSERGGRFILSPTFQHRRPKQMYLSNSNILLTRFLSLQMVWWRCVISCRYPWSPGVIELNRSTN